MPTARYLSCAETAKLLRQALKAKGLKRYDVWVLPTEWPTVLRFLARLKKRRMAK